MLYFRRLLASLRLPLSPRTDIVLENVALRHQIRVLSRQKKRPRLNRLDRMFWVCLSSFWATWRAFLLSHGLVACDFFIAPTLAFSILYVFVVLRHRDRRLLRGRVTSNPTVAWTAQQIREAFPFDEAPKYLLRDNDSIYGAEFSRAIANMGIKEIRTAKRSPWQNPFVERLIGSIRRECTDHIIPLNQRHLQRTLDAYQKYYNEDRCHLSLGKDSTEPQEIEPSERGAEIVAIRQVRGLHHRYARRAA